MPKILVLNDTRDQPNWGSQACAQALIDILIDRVPGAEIETYPAKWIFRKYRTRPGWLGGQPYRVRKLGRIERRVTRPFAFAPSVVDEFEHLADRWLDGRGGPGADQYVADLRRMDAVVFNAEGSTYRANYAARLGLFMLWLARTRFNVPSFFLNGTVALTDVDRVLPGMVRRTFRVLDAITVRESASQRNLAQYVPDAKVELVPDSVFAFTPDLTHAASPAAHALRERLAGQPYMVLSRSMLPMDLQRNLEQSSVVHLVQELKKVVPQVVLAGKDKGDQVLREVAARTDAQFFGAERSYADLAAVLETAGFLVSGRYHTIILASIVGCPAVPLITTSPKVDGLCEIMEGVLGDPFDATDLWSDVGGIVAAAEDHVANREARRRQLLDITARHRAATGAMGDVVQAALVRDEAVAGRRQASG
jgi:polysaccharide pyruvyl transferase WcaK-like protein